MASTKTTFLDLPAELRNHIYELALVDDEPLIAYIGKRIVRCDSDSTYHHYAVSQSKAFPEVPQLAQANRQIRKEALAVFYGQNTFIFSYALDPECHPFRWFYRHSANRPVPANFGSAMVEFFVAKPGMHGGFTMREASIKFMFSGEGEVVMAFCGALADQCTCGLARSLEKQMDICKGKSRMTFWGPDCFTLFKEDFQDCSRGVIKEGICGRCGKERNDECHRENRSWVSPE